MILIFDFTMSVSCPPLQKHKNSVSFMYSVSPKISTSNQIIIIGEGKILSLPQNIVAQF